MASYTQAESALQYLIKSGVDRRSLTIVTLKAYIEETGRHIADLENLVAEYERQRTEPADPVAAEAFRLAFKLPAAIARVLEALYSAPAGTYVRSSKLYDAMGSQALKPDRSGVDALLKVYISQLRKKLGVDAICTIRGLGYALTEPGRRIVAEKLGSRT